MADSIMFRGTQYHSLNSLWNDLNVNLSPKGENRELVKNAIQNTNGVRWVNLRELTENLAEKVKVDSSDMATFFDVLKLGMGKTYSNVKFSAIPGNIQNPFRNGQRGRKAREVADLSELFG